ncbi:capsular polysaccharide synthesis protein [Vibrio sp. TH_r3]|uniref:capsular polysaccharide synthesis protein n=1 Tax=Vibrio sp. TH_r3 TaxID=3082084 RepID=UPI002954D46B|nr:capsular polysaccharide synthesis protein [Vibrio sp. TH_r3]MDV7103469.1 capsular polysaccharide synthesis protein [Vibrio sp. TH_r3]
MDKPIWIYWENYRGQPDPAYITLCRWTMLHNWSDSNIIFINTSNIEYYIPNIRIRTCNINVDVRGRLDKLKRNIWPNKSDLAVKCDVYRANLVNTYGGIYCDASAIALKSIDNYFDIINTEKKFLVSKRQSHGKDHYPVSFYGAPPGSKVISEYVLKIDDLLSKKKNFHYNEIGAGSLTPIVNRNLSQTIVLDERKIMPITFENCDGLYLDKTIKVEDIVDDQQCVFKLFNNPFKTTLAEMSIRELYYSDYFIGKLFRHALPEEVFTRYLKDFNV